MRDEVDELVEAWEREREDLDLAPVAVFSRISRLARHLDLARRQAFTKHGIESWEFDVLSALRRSGPPYELSPGRLLRETLVTSGTMTNRVDRLAGRGLVERSPDPADRRGVIVRLTPEGKAAVDGAFAALLEAERELLADLPARDQQRLAGRGFVERYPDPADRRGVIVRLTPEGKAAVDGAFAALLEAERELLADLPARDQHRLAALLRTLLAPFS